MYTGFGGRQKRRKFNCADLSCAIYHPPASRTPIPVCDSASLPKARAECASSARSDLCGGRRATGVPTAIVYRLNRGLGRNFEAIDPLEWLARLADHIPDPGRHRTFAYGQYANRARGARAKEKAHLETAPAETPKKRRCSPNWARLISKVYHADPLTCRTCGGPSTTSALRRPRSSDPHHRSATSPSTTRGANSKPWWPRESARRSGAEKGLTDPSREP